MPKRKAAPRRGVQLIASREIALYSGRVIQAGKPFFVSLLEAERLTKDGCARIPGDRSAMTSHDVKRKDGSTRKNFPGEWIRATEDLQATYLHWGDGHIKRGQIVAVSCGVASDLIAIGAAQKLDRMPGQWPTEKEVFPIHPNTAGTLDQLIYTRGLPFENTLSDVLHFSVQRIDKNAAHVRKRPVSNP